MPGGAAPGHSRTRVTALGVLKWFGYIPATSPLYSGSHSLVVRQEIQSTCISCTHPNTLQRGAQGARGAPAPGRLHARVTHARVTLCPAETLFAGAFQPPDISRQGDPHRRVSFVPGGVARHPGKATPGHLHAWVTPCPGDSFPGGFRAGVTRSGGELRARVTESGQAPFKWQNV